MRVRTRATLWRMRWLIAAACVGTAIAVVLLQVRPPGPATTPVVVAAHDLSAGVVLGADDLHVRHDPDPPSHQPAAEDLIGLRMSVGLPAGMPLATTMLVGPGLADGAPPGTVVAPVRLADPAVLSLARPGDLVDLYLAPADTGGQREEADLITQGAVILSLPEAAVDDAGPFGTLAPPSSGDVVILAVRAGDAIALTGASGFAPFRAVLRDGTPE
ncbi:SAF domain-containing protein [Pseudactinotalea sp. Z1748]|uniref:SAF domain-containing protein n=1 Tax=Pseudactinotalea sp. Z1748 TaxID=3413027 RepID=UPI003C79AF0B